MSKYDNLTAEDMQKQESDASLLKMIEGDIFEGKKKREAEEYGAYKEYYDTKESIIKVSGMYKNGMKDGEWVEYDEKGTAIKTTTWKKGEMKK